MDVHELFSVSGKSVVVTGGSRGIGLMIAEGFVRAGARVVITARKAEACNEAAHRLSEHGECVSIPADLSVDGGRSAFAREVTERFDGTLHVLVNNAGATWGAPLDDFPEQGWDKVLDVNLKGLFELTRLLLPALRGGARDGDPARVVNIGSIDGLRVPALENYSYSAAKAGVHMLTRHLAKRLAGEQITVNAIAPGPFPSKMTAFMLDEHSDEVAATVPLGRIGEPEDMAGAALFLASRAGAYLTGTVLPVDGGIQA
jgi:NAD(P)-dependent dehydrogenase (short-subunit alcohol dehydrogenase family)